MVHLLRYLTLQRGEVWKSGDVLFAVMSMIPSMEIRMEELPQGQNLRIFLMDGHALFAGRQRTSSKKPDITQH